MNKNYCVTIISRKINSKLKKSVRQINCDVSKLDKLKEVLKNLKKNKLYFDIIIHNVGGSQKIYDHDVDYKSYELVWKSNLGYIVEINNNFIPYMRKKSGEELFTYLLLLLTITQHHPHILLPSLL